MAIYARREGQEARPVTSTEPGGGNNADTRNQTGLLDKVNGCGLPNTLHQKKKLVAGRVALDLFFATLRGRRGSGSRTTHLGYPTDFLSRRRQQLHMEKPRDNAQQGLMRKNYKSHAQKPNKNDC